MLELSAAVNSILYGLPLFMFIVTLLFDERFDERVIGVDGCIMA
jgi:hypothetical protein